MCCEIYGEKEGWMCHMVGGRERQIGNDKRVERGKEKSKMVWGKESRKYLG